MKTMVWYGVIVLLMTVSCNTLFDNGFDDALYRKERAAWEAQGLRHYRFVITSSASAEADFVPVPFTAEITVFPDREPEVVILYRDKERTEPYFDGKTIDAIYQRIADDVATLKDYERTVWYNKQYHYPKLYAQHLKLPDNVFINNFQIIITEFEPLGK
jgi:hypothetical protein